MINRECAKPFCFLFRVFDSRLRRALNIFKRGPVFCIHEQGL